MTLPAASVAEVRPGSGSDNNGGGYVTGSSGTDYSQQASAQYALSGLTTSGASATVSTASATSDMVGNWTQITAGTNFTTGIYNVASVVVGSSITFDRNVATGVGAAGTANVGGALATITKAEGVLVAGNTAWLKADGTNQTISSSIILSNPGDQTSGVITWQGYHTTRGDHDGTRPLITTATNNLMMIKDNASVTLNFRVFDNIDFSTTAGTPGYAFVPGFNRTTANWRISNCKLSGHKAAILSDN